MLRAASLSATNSLLSLALQNTGRRKPRTLSLVAAVAISTGAVFASAVLMRSIEISMDLGFSRLGADLLVVPEGTLTNITPALLTAEPSELTLDMSLATRLARLKGVNRIAPQLIFRTDASGYGAAHESVDLVAFDPSHDLTIQPWLDERLARPLRRGDIIVGGRRQEHLGSEVLMFGRPFVVYGKLAKTAVGTHERGMFMSFETFEEFKDTVRQICGASSNLEQNKISGVLIELMPGVTEQQIRFAVLANFPGVKVVAGASIVSAIRQGLTALFQGVFVLIAFMFGSTAVMAGVLFSAIITERRCELGLLKAIGARQHQIIGLLLIEAGIATTIGGALGCLTGTILLRLYEHSLVYHLTGLGIPFLWIDGLGVATIAVACILAATVMGTVGALYPAWRTSRHEPYDLIKGEC